MAPLVSGERALFVEQGSAWLVRLDGSAPLVTALAGPTERGLERTARTAFPLQGGSFFVFDTIGWYENVQRAFIVQPDGVVVDVPISAEWSDPHVAYASATKAYVFLEKRGDRASSTIPVQLATVDLLTHAIVGMSSSSLCAQEIIRSENRCMP
jgi:hypothetical protein